MSTPQRGLAVCPCCALGLLQRVTRLGAIASCTWPPPSPVLTVRALGRSRCNTTRLATAAATRAPSPCRGATYALVGLRRLPIYWKRQVTRCWLLPWLCLLGERDGMGIGKMETWRGPCMCGSAALTFWCNSCLRMVTCMESHFGSPVAPAGQAPDPGPNPLCFGP